MSDGRNATNRKRCCRSQAPANHRALRDAQQLEQQGRFAGGKAFFQNGEKWIDSDVQKQQSAKRVQVEFGSQEYFDLAKRAEAKAWLAQSRNVEFVLAGTIYEVVD